MSLATQDGKMWLDGELVNQPDAKVHVLTHSLHYGLAVFEGVRAYQTLTGVPPFSVYMNTPNAYLILPKFFS